MRHDLAGALAVPDPARTSGRFILVYDDVCIRNSPNPLYFDTAYSANGSMEGTLYPEFRTAWSSGE